MSATVSIAAGLDASDFDWKSLTYVASDAPRSPKLENRWVEKNGSFEGERIVSCRLKGACVVSGQPKVSSALRRVEQQTYLELWARLVLDPHTAVDDPKELMYHRLVRPLRQ